MKPHRFQNRYARVPGVCGVGAQCKPTHISPCGRRSEWVSPSDTHPHVPRPSTALTGNRGDAGGQVLLERVLVGLGLLGLRQDVVARVGQVGDLDVLRLRGAGPVPGVGVTALLRLHARPDALAAPQDQRHAVPDGLGHDLQVVLVEKPRVNLQGSTLSAGSRHTGTSSQQRKHLFETTLIDRDLFLLRTGTQELDGMGFSLGKISIPNALKNPRCNV